MEFICYIIFEYLLLIHVQFNLIIKIDIIEYFYAYLEMKNININMNISKRIINYFCVVGTGNILIPQNTEF